MRDGEYPSLFVDMHMKNKQFTLCVHWSEDGQWPSLQIIRTTKALNYLKIYVIITVIENIYRSHEEYMER